MLSGRRGLEAAHEAGHRMTLGEAVALVADVGSSLPGAVRDGVTGYGGGRASP
jgi:hypothetical protein